MHLPPLSDSLIRTFTRIVPRACHCIKLCYRPVDRTLVISILQNRFGPLARAAIILASLSLLILAFMVAVSPAASTDESPAAIDKRVTSQKQTLQDLKTELAALNEQIVNYDNALEQSRLEMAAANSRLRMAEDRYNEVMKTYEDRIVALYKQGNDMPIGIILGSEGVNDALTRISYMHKISDNDQKLIRRVKVEEQAVRSARLEVEQVKQANREDLDSLLLRKEELEAAIASGQKELDADLVKLETARAIEEEAQAERLAQEAAMLSFSNPGSVVIQNDPPPGLEPTGTVMFGVASWYGPGFHGNRTANGETYDMYALTAAHKTLPFNTWLKVSYNGRSVFVRINDRGPYVGERFLDLSKGSAQALGITGIAYVSAEVYR